MLSILPASLADLAEVQRLARVIWHGHYPGIITVEQIEYMLARGYSTESLSHFLSDEGSGLALARINGETVGFAAWYRPEEPHATKLDKLYVLQEQQGQGVGRALIEYVEAQARADGATTLILNVAKRNETSIAAYRKCAFEVRDAVKIAIGEGFFMDDYIMAKRL